jgi:hypothetical protein
MMQEHFYNLCMTESSRRDGERDQTRVSPKPGDDLNQTIQTTFMNRESTLLSTSKWASSNQRLYSMACDSVRNTGLSSQRRSKSFFTHCRRMWTLTVDFWVSGYLSQNSIVPRKTHKCNLSHNSFVLIGYEYNKLCVTTRNLRANPYKYINKYEYQ